MKQDAHGATALAPRKAKANAWEFDGFEVHPIARHTPLLGEARMEALKEHIKRCGPPPVLKHGDQILGDHNVCRACMELGIDVVYVPWDGQGSLGEAVARSIVDPRQHDASVRAGLAVPISEQLRTEIQPRRYNDRATLAGRSGNATKTAFPANQLESAQCANSSDSKHNPTPGGEHSAQRAAELFQVSESAVNQARHLWKEHPDLFAELLNGTLNLSQARLQSSRRRNAVKLTGTLGVSTRRNQSGTDDVIVGDCLKVMASWLGGPRFDLVFADPPYNLGWTYDADPTHDLLTESKYLEFSESWIKQCARLLKPNGSMFVMINAPWQDRLSVLMRGAGLHWRNTIVWHDTFPNNTSGNFEPAARFIHYFARERKGYTWNGDAVREPSVRDLIGDARRTHDNGAVIDNVWRIPRLVGNAKDRVPFEDAPPQVPALIVERCILAASNAGNRVFDPFTGNGTTWRAARKLGRAFTGIERSPKYAKQAEQWAMAQARL